MLAETVKGTIEYAVSGTGYPLERIDAPTLIVHGEADATVPYEHALIAVRTIPNARLAAVAEGTH
jgi:pimeloyl-ACP methyl ester carboxylesterase